MGLARLIASLTNTARDYGRGQAQAAALQASATAELDGQDGFPHFGMRGDPALTFAGYVASPQIFQGGVQMGANTNPSVQEYPAFPNDTPPPALPAWIADWDAEEGMGS